MTARYYTVDNLQAVTSIGYLIRRCAVLFAQVAERQFESQPVSMFQWMVLMQLVKCTHLSPTELGANLGHDLGALTRIVDELLQKGLVARERNEADRRAVQIAVTPAGRRLAQQTIPIAVELNNTLVEPYSTSETEVLISLLQRLMTHAQQCVAGTAPGSKASRPRAAGDSIGASQRRRQGES